MGCYVRLRGEIGEIGKDCARRREHLVDGARLDLRLAHEAQQLELVLEGELAAHAHAARARDVARRVQRLAGHGLGRVLDGDGELAQAGRSVRVLVLGVHERTEDCAISGNKWQSVTISGNQWQSVAISGNQWQPVAISGNQWQSPHPVVGASGHFSRSSAQISAEIIHPSPGK